MIKKNEYSMRYIFVSVAVELVVVREVIVVVVVLVVSLP